MCHHWDIPASLTVVEKGPHNATWRHLYWSHNIARTLGLFICHSSTGRRSPSSLKTYPTYGSGTEHRGTICIAYSWYAQISSYRYQEIEGTCMPWLVLAHVTFYVVGLQEMHVLQWQLSREFFCTDSKKPSLMHLCCTTRWGQHSNVSGANGILTCVPILW